MQMQNIKQRLSFTGDTLMATGYGIVNHREQIHLQ